MDKQSKRFETVLTSIPFIELEDSIRMIVREELDRKKTQLKKQPRAFSRNATAKLLSVSPPTLDQYIKSGRIKAKKIGNRVLISDVEINNFLGSGS